MPIYDKRCIACGYEFELCTLTDAACCPQCTSEELTTLLTRSNFRLKGRGWSSDNYDRVDSEKYKPGFDAKKRMSANLKKVLSLPRDGKTTPIKDVLR